jgi:hypothetical protein
LHTHNILGDSFATYSSQSLTLTLYSRSHPPSTLCVPKLELLFTYPTPTNTTFGIHGVHSTFTNESIFGITPDFEILHVIIEADTGKMVLHSRDRLPLLSKLPSSTCKDSSSEATSSDSENPLTPENHLKEPSSEYTVKSPFNNEGNWVKKIIQVDPMAWGRGWDEWADYRKTSITGSPVLTRSKLKASTDGARDGQGGWQDRDVLLSVTECGELAFWVPEAYTGSRGPGEGTGWRCTGRVRTERTGFNRARCSSAKKTALGMLYAIFSVSQCIH